MSNVLEAVITRPRNIEDLRPLELLHPPSDEPWNKITLKPADIIRPSNTGHYLLEEMLLFPPETWPNELLRKVMEALKRPISEPKPGGDASGRDNILPVTRFFTAFANSRRLAVALGIPTADQYLEDWKALGLNLLGKIENRTIDIQRFAVNAQASFLINLKVCLPEVNIELAASNLTPANNILEQYDYSEKGEGTADFFQELALLKIISPTSFENLDVENSAIYQRHLTIAKIDPNADWMSTAHLMILAAARVDITPNGLKLNGLKLTLFPRELDTINTSPLPERKRFTA